MKKLIYSLFAVLILIASGCRYNDTDLWNSVNNLDKRVTSLEELCKQINTNITSIQTIINVSKDGDYITSITPIIEGGKEIGYTISFSKSPSITIYHGKDGKDGYAPSISVKQDIDGHYYWTLDGEWLIDDNGCKVLAEGKAGIQGQNAVIPIFKIENEGWYLSLDSGKTWIYLGKAVGEDGQGGNNGKEGDSMFTSIDTTNDDYVIFTLADGTEFRIPRYIDLIISFEGDNLETIRTNSTREIGYKISGNTKNLQVEVLSLGNIRAKISSTSSSKGILTVMTGSTISEYDKVVILASNGNTTIMKSLSFEEAGVNITSGLSYNIPTEGNLIQINFETNTECSLYIPQEAQNWIRISSPARAWSEETLSLQIEPNENSNIREAVIAIVDMDGVPYQNILIKQEGNSIVPSDLEMVFPDPIFRSYILKNFDTDNNGKISNEEALNVTSIHTPTWDVESVVGIEYFPNLTTLYIYSKKMTSLDLSKVPQLIVLYCRTGKLKEINLSNSIKLQKIDCYGNELKTIDVSNCPELTYLDCGQNQLTDIDVALNPKLEFLGCYLNQLTTLNVSNNKKLKTLSFHTNSIYSIDLSNNKDLEYLYCMTNQLTRLDLSNNPKLKDLSFYENQLRSIDLSQLPELSGIRGYSNFLTDLDLSGNPNLQILYCEGNNLSSLDVRSNSKLETLDCSKNNLTELDVRSNSKLETLNCSQNNLTELDLSQNSNLKNIDASSNLLTTIDLSKTRVNNGNIILAPMSTLKILYLNADWEEECISFGYWDYDTETYISTIPEQTQIIYID